MPIFQDNSGLAVKFFIQKDLAEEIQAELCETITSLGGRVESKVPRQGYILVQPGTSEEERLRLCWTSSDRPDRHFVPYTYVEACKIAGMLLKQIFVREGEPIKMHMHPSIANVNARTVLSQRIMHSGGDPHASAQSARVILADPNTEIFQHLVKIYQGVADKYIESYLWVKKCIEKGTLVYTPLVYKNPGGRRPGEERTQFTEEDEERLCGWIAAKIPYKETGGRTGNRLYQQLCDLGNDPEYAWVARHTWQSWRERYKKNARRLDSMIATIVDQKKPIQGEKGQYGYVRKAEEKQKRRRKRGKNANHVHSDDEFTRDQEGILAVTAIPNVLITNIQPMQALGAITQMGLPGVGDMYRGVAGGPPLSNRCGPLGRLALGEGAAEEEMADGEEGHDWAVRIRNEPPPTWGKRKGTEANENESNKRPRPNGLTLTPPQDIPQARELITSPSRQININAQTLLAIANIHVIDQGIRDIAKEFRFTVEEVQEYYDKCGEMARTRTRFQKMRMELQKFMNDDLN